MNIVRERKLNARAHRQEILHPIAKKTVIQVPQPKELNKKETVIVKTKLPEVTEIAKRGRGRPPKAVSDKINKSNKKNLAGKKTVKGKGKK